MRLIELIENKNFAKVSFIKEETEGKKIIHGDWYFDSIFLRLRGGSKETLIFLERLVSFFDDDAIQVEDVNGNILKLTFFKSKVVQFF